MFHNIVDVGGVVTYVRPIVNTVKNNVETKRLMFELTDGRLAIFIP